MNINLKQPICNLKGEPLKDNEGEILTFGRALANILAGSKTKGGMKLFILAKKCFEQDVIEIDKADLGLIKNEVKSSEVYSGILVTAQCELLLEDIKEEE